MLLFLSASSWQQFLMSLISPGLLTDCISTLVYNDGIVSRLASSAGLVIWGEVVKDDNNSSIQTTLRMDQTKKKNYTRNSMHQHSI